MKWKDNQSKPYLALEACVAGEGRCGQYHVRHRWSDVFEYQTLGCARKLTLARANALCGSRLWDMWWPSQIGRFDNRYLERTIFKVQKAPDFSCLSRCLKPRERDGLFIDAFRKTITASLIAQVARLPKTKPIAMGFQHETRRVQKNPRSHLLVRKGVGRTHRTVQRYWDSFLFDSVCSQQTESVLGEQYKRVSQKCKSFCGQFNRALPKTVSVTSDNSDFCCLMPYGDAHCSMRYKNRSVTVRHQITVNLEADECESLLKISVQSERSLVRLGCKSICDTVKSNTNRGHRIDNHLLNAISSERQISL